MTSQIEMARAERAEFTRFLATLTPGQWDAPTLCPKWSVKDVVAHVISYEELGTVGLARRFVRGRVVNANQVGVEEYSTPTPAQLLEFLRAHQQPHGLTAAFGGMIALVDGMIHQQDIRRPLGLPRTIPEERLRRVLQLTARNPRLGVPARIRGLRLRANDIQWARGRGAEVTGPGEALMMAMAGRHAALAELSGDGLPTLAARLGRQA